MNQINIMSPDTEKASKQQTSFAIRSTRSGQFLRLFSVSRDKGDTLLLIAACFSVLLTHFAALAWWVSLSCSTLMLARSWLTLKGYRLPKAQLLLLISLSLMAGVYLEFHSFLGREAGVTMLALLLSCKLFEMHAKRDALVLIYLGFFLLLCSFFNSQSIASSFLACCCTVLLLTAQLSFQYAAVQPPLRQRIKLSLSILGLAIPLTLVCFLLFPRIQGPLWSLPGDAQTGRSGLSDSMTAGNISKLILSEDIAFRVKFSEHAKIPEKSQLYWRGVVLNNFDGQTWSHQTNSEIASDQAEQSALLLNNTASLITPENNPVQQEIILEASGQHWLFGLDIPAKSSLGQINHLHEISTSAAIDKRVSYTVESYPTLPAQTLLSPRLSYNARLLPRDLNPLSFALAQKISQNSRTPMEKIQAVLKLFNQQKFIYTLEPPLLGQHNIDDFLFRTRAGFCEHYSSAFVFMMRAMGLPARVVTGYQGGTLNEVDAYYIVRQSDAHAWAEVWIDQRGWVRVDPTAAVAPERVMQNLSSSQAGVTGLMRRTLGATSWLRQLGMQWDAMNNSWNIWVLSYNQSKQINLMHTLGISEANYLRLILIFMTAGGLTLFAMWFSYMRKTISMSPADRLYLRLCTQLEKRGITKARHEAALGFSLRIKQELSHSASSGKSLQSAIDYPSVREFLALYARHKYARDTLAETVLLARLKTLLRQSFKANLPTARHDLSDHSDHSDQQRSDP